MNSEKLKEFEFKRIELRSLLNKSKFSFKRFKLEKSFFEAYGFPNKDEVRLSLDVPIKSKEFNEIRRISFSFFFKKNKSLNFCEYFSKKERSFKKENEFSSKTILSFVSFFAFSISKFLR